MTPHLKLLMADYKDLRTSVGGQTARALIIATAIDGLAITIRESLNELTSVLNGLAAHLMLK